jgi:glycosyltransferase involved in cell wall biosynthesis
MRSCRVDIQAVGVVVPARNEERGLAACLRGLSASAAAADVPVFAVVVLDSCTDDSAAVAADALAMSSLPALCMTTDAATVGGARRQGVEYLLSDTGGPDPVRLWIATTDADSLVPTNWIAGHVRHARAGSEIVAGTVDVEDWTHWLPAVEDVYRRQYATGLVADGHGHVHGANLGIRADTYLAVGGFRPVSGDEDVDLIRRAQASGVAVTWAMDIPVRTSARPVGRTTAGFASHLRDIATRLADDEAAVRES